MKFRFWFCAALIFSSLTAMAQAAPASSSKVSKTPVTSAPKPVAHVNGVVLTDRDLMRQMMNDFPYAKQHGGHFPKELEADIRSSALKEIEFEELVYQEAIRRKLTVSPAKLDKAMVEFKKQFPSPAAFQEYLKLEQNGSMRRLRQKVRRAILIDQVLNTDVNQKARTTNAELRAFYNKNLERFRKPESVSIQTISLVIPDNATASEQATIRKRAEDALRQARATKDYEGFGSLAEKVSEDDWRVMMGDHKSIHRGRMPPPVEKVAFSMKPGEVSDLIRAENSWCIVRLNAREDAKLVPFEEVRLKIKKELESRKAETLRFTLDARLRKNAQVVEP